MVSRAGSAAIESAPTFDINHHRWVAQKAREGRASQHTVEASQEALLAEVERLTYLVSSTHPAHSDPIEAQTLGEVIASLAGQPRNAAVLVDYYGARSQPGEISSYAAYDDQLRIGPQGREPKTVGEVLEDLRRFRKYGITGREGGGYPVTDATALWVAYYAEESQQRVSGVRVDGGIVIIMTESRDW